jgi:hypothetical protein
MSTSVRRKYILSLRRAPLITAVALASALGGCACEDRGWQTVVAVNAEPLGPPPNCDFSNLERLSKSTASLAGKADPRLLEVARLEAERDCYKAAAAAARARQRT